MSESVASDLEVVVCVNTLLQFCNEGAYIICEVMMKWCSGWSGAHCVCTRVIPEWLGIGILPISWTTLACGLDRWQLSLKYVIISLLMQFSSTVAFHH